MTSSLPMIFGPATRSVFAATAAAKGAAGGSSSSSSSEEKGLLDFIIGALNKDESMLEVDPILKKKDDKNAAQKNSVAVPPKKNGGFGGLFAKK